MHRTHTTWERLLEAVKALAAGEERIQRRLNHALNLLTPLQTAEFPAELQVPVPQLRDRVRAAEDPYNRGKNAAFADSLSDSEASNIASEVVSWFNTVAREHCS